MRTEKDINTAAIELAKKIDATCHVVSTKWHIFPDNITELGRDYLELAKHSSAIAKKIKHKTVYSKALAVVGHSLIIVTRSGYLPVIKKTIEAKRFNSFLRVLKNSTHELDTLAMKDAVFMLENWLNIQSKPTWSPIETLVLATLGIEAKHNKVNILPIKPKKITIER
ncbi:hypothetical protein [Endozoicomonas sp. ONNA1]|uniref:hypothetical protein n=1 Tax=Endozoicomonas sp. ONNA1 TaxID=2828740 RepID=UPI002148135C|nr:hypothetical protein [Endozoicomonas sp. ONNA1]